MSGVRPRLSRSKAGGAGAFARIALALGALLVAAALGAQDLEVIELRHRPADEIVPIVEPLLAPGGVLTGADDRLLVRTSPANLAQIRAAVAAVDRARRQLRISVGQGTVGERTAADVRGSATVGDGDVRAGVNRPPAASSGAEVRAGARTVKSDVRNVSTVQTLEGSETYISIGQAVPVRTTHVMPGRRGPTLRRSTAYVDVASGFYATARLSGDQVTLEISPQQQRLQPGQAGGSIQSRGLSSTVTGRLGEWIELGAVREQSSESTAGVLVWGRRSEESAYSAFVRVEALP